MCLSIITLKTEGLALTLNDCLSSGLKLNLVGKMRSPGLRLGEPVQPPWAGAGPSRSRRWGLARSPTLPRGARSPAGPLCAELPSGGRLPQRAPPRPLAGGEGAGAAGRRAALLFPRSQLGAGSAPRRPSLGRSPWGRLGLEGAVTGPSAAGACGMERRGRRTEKRNSGAGAWGGPSCVRGGSDARARSWVARVTWRRDACEARPSRGARGRGGRAARGAGRGRPRPDYTDTNSLAALKE